MADRRVVLTDLARRDVEDAVDRYAEVADATTALAFVDAFEAAVRRLAANPAIGSPRYAAELDLPGLRAWPVHGDPHVLFHVERGGDVDVWRVLDARRDLVAWLADPNDGGEGSGAGDA